jgi:hypothetical protein
MQDTARVHRLTKMAVVSSTTDGAAASLVPAPLTAPSMLDLLLSIPSLQCPIFELLQFVLLSALRQPNHGSTALTPAPLPTLPALVTADEAAKLMPPPEDLAAACATRWDAICAAPLAALPRDTTPTTSATAKVLPTGAATDAASTSCSPEVLYALAHPSEYLTSYGLLSPLILAASTAAADADDMYAGARTVLLFLAKTARTLNPLSLHATRAGRQHLGLPAPTAESLRQMLASAPLELRPHIAALTPLLLPPSQHTMASGVLLSAVSAGPPELQIVVAATLAALEFDPSFAECMLVDTLADLASLPQSELPGAIALAARVAGDSQEAAAKCARAARAAVHAHGHDVSLASLQTLSLVALQYDSIAEALLADIAHATTATSGPVTATGTQSPNSAVLVVTPMADGDLLLEMLQSAHLREEALSVLQGLVAQGLLSAGDMRLLLERRRMQHTMFCSLAARLASSAPPMWQLQISLPAGLAPLQATSCTSSGAGVRASQAPWPSAVLPPPASASTGVQLSTAHDGFDVILSLACNLAACAAPTAQSFALSLYLQMFMLWPSTHSRVRLIHALAHRIADPAVSIAPPPAAHPAASAATTSPPPPPLPPPPSLSTTKAQETRALLAITVESRALLAITEEWPNFSSSVLLCLMDLVAKQAVAAKAAVAMRTDASRALEATREQLAAAKAKLTEEHQRANVAAAAAGRSAADRLAASDAEKAVLAAEVSDLQDQV